MKKTTLSVMVAACFVTAAAAEDNKNTKQLEEVVVSASRVEQSAFDAPASVNSVKVDAFSQMSPLVNISELLSAVPGVQVKDRQNFAQDLQISVRGFGTRSTFGVRGVRILVDGIPATMPDGQGQAATASLTSAERIELLRGPVAQMYGNAAGGVLQVFSKNPEISDKPVFTGSIGAGSYNQRQYNFGISGGTKELGAWIDMTQFSTSGYRQQSAAERTQFTSKVVANISDDTRITTLLNSFNQFAQDPTGLNYAEFQKTPWKANPSAISNNARKTIDQNQVGAVIEHRLSSTDSLTASAYGGTRQVWQMQSAGTVVDLDRNYSGASFSWNRQTTINAMPLRLTAGTEYGTLQERRKGLSNVNALTRNEDATATNMDYFAQASLAFSPTWEALAGVRTSTVRFGVKDYFTAGGTADDSGKVKNKNTSPVAGLVWHATDTINIYGNIGRGFETPTLSEAAYKDTLNAGGGLNTNLKPSTSTQAEIGLKWREANHILDFAIFNARSNNEIVVKESSGGRTVYQNVDNVTRSGMELFWKANWKKINTIVGYTLLNATFDKEFTGTSTVAAGNTLPGAAKHSLYAEIEGKATENLKLALETRMESRVYTNDTNANWAAGYAVFNLRAGEEIKIGSKKLFLFGRVDNLFDRNYAGSVIVNATFNRFYEPAAGRRLFVGLRGTF